MLLVVEFERTALLFSLVAEDRSVRTVVLLDLSDELLLTLLLSEELLLTLLLSEESPLNEEVRPPEVLPPDDSPLKSDADERPVLEDTLLLPAPYRPSVVIRPAEFDR